jgi:hypothetical protein
VLAVPHHNKLGFAVQLCTVRYAGRFLDHPLEGVPGGLVEHLAEQPESEASPCLSVGAMHRNWLPHRDGPCAQTRAELGRLGSWSCQPARVSRPR